MADSVDVLFINPGDRKQIYQGLGNEFSAIEPPVFAGLFATYARQKGHSVAIYDAPAMMASAEEVARVATEDFDAKLIVIVVYGFQPSASTQNMTAAGDIAQRIKDTETGVRVMMTGTHPAALPVKTMQEEAVDFVVDLEGPVTIYKTLQALIAGHDEFSDIPSLWWRSGAEIVRPRSAEPLLQNLDVDMPGIAWDLLPMDRYRAHNWHSFDHIHDRSPYASIHTSLGCPYKCSFCCINAPFGKSSYRMWSPDCVIQEIDHLVENYGIKNIKFVDEMFVLNKAHVMGLCDLLKGRDYDVNIWAYARVDTVQDEFLDNLKAAGINWLCLGIESASDHVRDGALKKYGNDDIIDVVRRIQDAGIYIIGNYIFGLPDDNISRMQETYDLAAELNCEFANFYSAMAYPGSSLYDSAIQDGVELPDTWKDFSQHGYKAKPLSNKFCSAAEILEFRDKAFDQYFTSPTYLNMVKEKFGQDVVDHVARMVSIPLSRKLLEERTAA
ncbi:MAG: radical SAM protein [Rhodospirillales bacterium]|nr:radical SAM protein [Rhodospirillales bacterium]